jgi:hypothetical protein
MLIINSERLRALTKRGLVAFSRTENLRALRSELLEMALAIDELIQGKGTEEDAALEGADVLFLLDRFATLMGFELWKQVLRIKFAKAERKVLEQEAAKAAEAAK